MPPIRNRIRCHRRIRAGDLVPNEWNFRLHPEFQKAALQSLYAQIGFARSLLAYELPDGRLKLIDGHLRRDVDPDMEVEVEILDVTEDEARALLLTIDPLAALAQTQELTRQKLLESLPPPPPELLSAWQAAAQSALDSSRPISRPPLPEQFLIVITCKDEKHQTELLQRFASEDLQYKAIIS